MKRFILLFALTALLLLMCPTAAAGAGEGYYFESIDTRVHVNLDNSVNVVKYVRVNFTEPKHGLYWYLNAHWDENKLRYYDIDIEGAPYEVRHNSEYITFKIGDPDSTVTGPVDYIIRYSVNPGKDKNPELDALYMNIQAHEHPCPVEKTTFSITLPQPVEPSYIAVIAGGTDYASTDNPVEYSYSEDTLTGMATRQLNAYEGITVKIDLPEGYFSEARDPYALQKTLAWVIPLLCILIGSLLWYVYGRDPAFVIPVELSAPDGISPAEAGFIIDGIADNDDAASLLIYWASLGYMTIDERKKKTYTFIKQKDMGDERPAYEKRMFDSLFSDDTEVSESKAKNRLGTASSALKVSLKSKYERGGTTLIDKKSLTVSKIVMALASICMIAAGYYLGLVFSPETALILAFITLIPLPVIKALITTALSYGRRRKKFTNFILIIFISALFVLIWFIFYSVSQSGYSAIPGWNFALLIFGSGYLIVASHYAKRMTGYGHRIFERVLGFRMFMNTAHKDRLETLAADNPAFFYDRLPYALALGVSSVWIGKFADIVKEPPAWYTGYHYSAFNMLYFSRSFTRTAMNVSTPVSKSYSSGYRPGGSSFSSGGGFSGGGFSGGGSGSW